MNPAPLPLILPTGTKVVVRVHVPRGAGLPDVPQGSVGVVVRSPSDATHAYSVEFADGTRAALRRTEIRILKHVKSELGDAFIPADEFEAYTMSQFKKLEQDIRTTGDIKWKHAMHLLRLLLSGTGVLRDGDLCVDAGPHRERLLEIKSGAVPWDDVDRWRLALHREFEEAFATTRLPERPDYAVANDFLVRARRSAL